MTITTRPDQDFALRAMRRDRIPIMPVFKEFAVKQLPKEFAANCDYELHFAAVHFGEGNLHTHAIYSSVSKDGRLLHRREGRGKKGPHLLGPSVVGLSRLYEAGFIGADEGGKFAEKCIARSVRSLDGACPLDKALADAWTIRLDKLAEDPKFAKYFVQGRREYQSQIKQARMNDPRRRILALQGELARANVARRELAEKNAELQKYVTIYVESNAVLRGRLEELSSKIDNTPPKEPEFHTSPAVPNSKPVEPSVPASAVKEFPSPSLEADLETAKNLARSIKVDRSPNFGG